MIRYFQNQLNGHIEKYNPNTAPLWCFLFGPIYWAARGNVFHAVLCGSLSLLTMLTSQLVYPFFTNGINLRAFSRKDWKELSVNSGYFPFQTEPQKPNTSGYADRKILPELAHSRLQANSYRLVISCLIGIPIGLYIAHTLILGNTGSGSFLHGVFN